MPTGAANKRHGDYDAVFPPCKEGPNRQMTVDIRSKWARSPYRVLGFTCRLERIPNLISDHGQCKCIYIQMQRTWGGGDR